MIQETYFSLNITPLEENVYLSNILKNFMLLFQIISPTIGTMAVP